MLLIRHATRNERKRRRRRTTMTANVGEIINAGKEKQDVVRKGKKAAHLENHKGRRNRTGYTNKQAEH